MDDIIDVLIDLLKDRAKRDCGNIPYTLYFDGKPLKYNNKPVRLQEVASGTASIHFFTLKRSSNSNKFEQEILSTKQLKSAFSSVCNNTISFFENSYSFNGFTSNIAPSVSDRFYISVKSTPRIIWISSTIYAFLVEGMRTQGLAQTIRFLKIQDDEKRINPDDPSSVLIFMDVFKSLIYKNYINFITSKVFTQTFVNQHFLFFYKVTGFSIVNIRYQHSETGDIALVNPVFDDVVAMNNLRYRDEYKYFLKPECDRVGDFSSFANLREETVGSYKCIFMDDLTISKVIGLKYKFNFTPALAIPLWISDYIPTRYAIYDVNFASFDISVYKLNNMGLIEYGYPDWISVEEYNKLPSDTRVNYTKYSCAQRFVLEKEGSFKSRGMRASHVTVNYMVRK